MISVTTKQFGFPVFDVFLDNLWDRPITHFSVSGLLNAAVNIREDEDAFSVVLVAPGRSKDVFKLDLNDKVLTISSEDKQEKEAHSEDKVYRKEFSLLYPIVFVIKKEKLNFVVTTLQKTTFQYGTKSTVKYI